VLTEILTAGEQGLLGLAFDPDFAQNGYFYVNLINSSGDTEIRRYHVCSTNPNQTDAASATLIITIDQPDGISNHKAGWLGFGPDGYLYAALGDGGGGDPFHNGQNIDTLPATIFRLDVHSDGFPGDPNRNYAMFVKSTTTGHRPDSARTGSPPTSLRCPRTTSALEAPRCSLRSERLVGLAVYTHNGLP